MKTQTATIVYGAVQHLASIAAIATLMGTGNLSQDVGAPILAGLVGIGVGAGAALIIPGVSAVPTGTLAPPPLAGGAVPAATTDAVRPQGAAAPVEQVQAIQPPAQAAQGSPGAPGGQPVAS